MKYLLLSESAWETSEEQACAKFDLPNAQAKRYAKKSQVANSDNANFGKFIFPVMTSGPWKCDDLFTGGVAWDDDWVSPE